MNHSACCAGVAGASLSRSRRAIGVSPDGEPCGAAASMRSASAAIVGASKIQRSGASPPNSRRTRIISRVASSK